MELLNRRLGALLGTLRALYRQIINRYFGKIRRFNGDARQICAQIISKLWQGDFYRTSLGHFDFFWMRDFGTVAESLTKLGHDKRVRHTLSWALLHYMAADHVTQCIDRTGNTFNAPAKKSVDALPWLLHSLTVSNYRLHSFEREFLNRRIANYVKVYLYPKSGDLRRNLRYAELRDAVNYDRSAYAITLIGRMSTCAEQLGLEFPYPPKTYHDLLLKHYWNGHYFKADRSTNAYSSESALMPFFLGVVDDKTLAGKTFDYINQQQLNQPYPLQYSQHPEKFHYRPTMNQTVMPEYTGNTIWTWHATFYLHSLLRYKRPEYAAQYYKFAELIERHGTYPELVNHDGSWYKAPFYMADPGMVWAALFLELPTPSKMAIKHT
ncbi:MAG: hypothetical protein WAS27_01190 [Candidatus Saccharimonadales bacterium]